MLIFSVCVGRVCVPPPQRIKVQFTQNYVQDKKIAAI